MTPCVSFLNEHHGSGYEIDLLHSHRTLVQTNCAKAARLQYYLNLALAWERRERGIVPCQSDVGDKSIAVHRDLRNKASFFSIFSFGGVFVGPEPVLANDRSFFS